MVALSPLAGAGWQFFDSNGNPLSGGLLYTYLAGTTTPATTYTTSSGINPNSNPVVLDSAGRVPYEIWQDPTLDYKYILKTSTGTDIWTKDNIPGMASAADLVALQTEYDAYTASLASASGAGLIGITGGQTLQSWINNRLTDVKKFGVVADGVTDDAAAWATAIAAGVPLWWGGGTSCAYSNVNLLNNTVIIGAGPQYCRLQKMFFESGSKALLQPTGLDNTTGTGAGVDNVTLMGFTVGCEPGVYSNGGTVSGKMIATGRTQGWWLENIAVDYWNGFALTLAGRGHTVDGIKFSNPNNSTGVDGVHIAECDDEALPHFVADITGTTGDDIVGCFPAASGPLANANILGAVINNVRGESLNARVFACGFAAASLTGRVANITATGLQGKGASATNGAITINNQATATAILENITVDGVVDGTGSQAYLAVRGVASGEPASRMRNINVRLASTNNTTGPSDNAVLLVNLIENLKLDLALDATNVTSYGLTWSNVYNSKGYDFRGWIKAGADNGFHLGGSATFMNGGNIDLAIENIATSKIGFNVAGLRNTTVKLTLNKKSGATTTVGINEGAACQNNNFSNGDFSGVDTAVSLAQTDSVYFNNVGYVTEYQGTSSVSAAATTKAVVFPTALGYTPTAAEITITPTTTLAAGTHWWLTSISSTGFTLNLSAAAAGTVSFSYAIRRVKQ